MSKIKSNGLFTQKNVEILKVIRTNLTTRGDGVRNPIRIITQYWSLDGEMLFENDPLLLETREMLREAKDEQQTHTK